MRKEVAAKICTILYPTIVAIVLTFQGILIGVSFKSHAEAKQINTEMQTVSSHK